MGLDFEEGSSQYVLVPYDGGFNAADGVGITILCRVKAESLTDSSWIICKHAGSASTPNYGLYLSDTDGKIVFNYRGTAGWQSWASTNGWAAGTWLDIGFSYTMGTAGSVKLVVNGVSEAGSWVSGDGNAIAQTGTEPLYIAYGHGNSAYYFDGIIQHLGLYIDKAMSIEEMKTRLQGRRLVAEEDLAGYWPFDEMMGTNAADLSANGHTGKDGTLQNSPTWVEGYPIAVGAPLMVS